MNSEICVDGAKLLSRVGKIGFRLQDLAGGSYQERGFHKPRDCSDRSFDASLPSTQGTSLTSAPGKTAISADRSIADIFITRAGYFTTNFGTAQGEMQGGAHEIYLNLEDDLESNRLGRYDVVFNHTTLEHVWNFRKAFYNLCAMDSDTVVLVVPWLQPLHSSYGDYWRFSPQTVARLFAEQKMTTLYLSWNHDVRSAVYVFAIATHDHGLHWE